MAGDDDAAAVRLFPQDLDGGVDAVLLAMKGSSAADEIERAQKVLTKLGGIDPTITRYGMGEVEVPTTVVQVRRRPKASRKGDARG